MSLLVSINCITYNHERYIAEAIEGFLMQKTNFQFEILIHDDASTDRTPDIIREYENRYPDIVKSILQKENQYSKGIKNIDYQYNFLRAKGKYIAICEGDDYWTDSGKLQKQVDYMEHNSKCSMCFHAAEIVKNGKGVISEIRPYNNNCISPTEDIILGGGEFIATNSIIYRKDIMDNAPELYFKSPVGDYPLQILSSIGDYAYYINETMSVYRVGVEGSWTSRMLTGENREEKLIKNGNEIIDMLNEFNKYVNGKYSNAINKRIIKEEFEILKVEKKIKLMNEAKYKLFYKSLSNKEKLNIHAQYYFPKAYRKLLKIKKYIKDKL